MPQLVVKKATFLPSYLASCCGTSSRMNCWEAVAPASAVGSGAVTSTNSMPRALGVLDHQVMTADDQLHGHVAREGVVDEHVDAPVGAGLHDGVALLDLVGVHDDVGSLGDDGRVFLRHARDEEDVVAAHLTDGVEGGGGARHGLAHHDGLHVGVGGERRQLGDGGLLLAMNWSVVGVGDDVVRILLLESLGGAETLPRPGRWCRS